MRLCNKGGYCLYAVHVALGESATLATATAPERDLADLERMAREYDRTIDIGYLLRGYEYQGEFHYVARGPQRTITRAEALALLEKGAK